jgi:ketosteroid isomerase-like protein
MAQTFMVARSASAITTSGEVVYRTAPDVAPLHLDSRAGMAGEGGRPMSRAADFVESFRRYWAAPSLGGFDAVLADDVVLVQPLSPTMRGLAGVHAGFTPIFTWLPDLRGEVDRWGASGDIVFIEFRLRATIGGKPFEWPLVDRFVLREDGKAIERVSYFDPLRIIAATLTRPSSWRSFVRSGAAGALVASWRTAGRETVTHVSPRTSVTRGTI